MRPEIASDKLTISEEVLSEASHAVRTRNLIHGHTLRSFTMIAEMWTTYIKHAYTIRGVMELRADDVAQMQAIVKQVRSIYGESNDNYIDEAGYAALSAMLRPDAMKKWELDRKKEAAKEPAAKSNFEGKREHLTPRFEESTANEAQRKVPRMPVTDHPLLKPISPTD